MTEENRVIELRLPRSIYDRLREAGSASERISIACREYIMSSPAALEHEENLVGRPDFQEDTIVIRWLCPSDIQRRIPRMEGLGQSHIVAAVKQYLSRGGRFLEPVNPSPEPTKQSAAPEFEEIEFCMGVEEMKEFLALKVLLSEALRLFDGRITPESGKVSLRFRSPCGTYTVRLPSDAVQRLPGEWHARQEFIRSSIRAYVARQ